MLKTFVATLCVIGVALGGEAPVLLWGANSPSQPALNTLAQDDFAEIIAPLLDEHMVVVFQDEGLTANDLHCSSSEESCYAFLGSASQRTYYPSVANPAEAVRSVAAQREFNTVGKSGKLETPMSCEPRKAVFINFDKTEGKRAAILESHDAAISAIVGEIKCPTVYLYTATPSSVSPVQKRTRRSTAAATGGTVLRAGSDFLIFFTEFWVIDAKTKTALNLTGISLTHNQSDSFQIELTGANSPVTFNISLNGGYYTLNALEYNGNKYFTNGIDAPTTFSYFCGNLTLQARGDGAVASTNFIQWNSLQFQAPFSAVANESFVFSEPWHCVGFFTPGILSGLFVVVLMLSITFVGVCWMMDINTMDRFDDPKGKTITINAAE